MKRDWYRIENKDKGSVADLYIYDEIGKSFFNDDAVSAKEFIDGVRALPSSVKTIRVHLNSPGGNVFDAVAITNELRDQSRKGRTVETIVDGLAASAASIVMMAGDPAKIGDNAFVMIHDPRVFAGGNAATLRSFAGKLDQIRDAIVATYKWRASVDEDAIRTMMAADGGNGTWMDADSALANGFASEKVEGLHAVASLSPRAFEGLDIPEEFRERVQALIKTPGSDRNDDKPKPTEPAEPQTAAAATEVLALCRENGCLDVAEELVTAGASLKDVRTRVAAEKETRQKAEAREKEIRGLCEKAKLDELADGYISGQMPIDSVRAQLTTLTAKMDGPEIDGGLDPNHGQPDAATSWKNAFARASNRFGARRRDTK